ncbi:hypothetical protein RO3G_11338 [Rhizopus delemar RA 99-880]|uniref:Uncharacterized protein n=1 Tax=Rhizopus delemar (strain RA 99-880 / ATCC MYA-4621 / FGSC 9543 / NRRL 43880) TaxID=246409 RepID=I1CDU7_RHIO9|nr:hypothetical protein RO3G_11338 [Rhizopus delemar RA 99-880]|eukprot:EIE86627.1 hypothetical protein RO3G_11338 [Rhizopus delemar RA 99-880]
MNRHRTSLITLSLGLVTNVNKVMDVSPVSFRQWYMNRGDKVKVIPDINSDGEDYWLYSHCLFFKTFKHQSLSQTKV